MINPMGLEESDKNTRVVYRADGASGPPEWCTIVSWDSRYIYIRVDGDAVITKARPNEVTWRAL